MPEEIKPMRYKRSCGHYADNHIFCQGDNEKILIYCLPCIAEKAGVKPCEILSAEEYCNKYLKVVEG
jgi:hypothetical protein